MHVYICRTESRGLVQDKWTLPETHQTKNTSSIQSTEVHQQRQNIDIKENQVIFLNLFLGGHGLSEPLGAPNKPTKGWVNHTHLETLEHMTEIWKYASEISVLIYKPPNIENMFVTLFKDKWFQWSYNSFSLWNTTATISCISTKT